MLWKNEILTIEALLKEGITAEEIGKRYNVSRQRIYQVLTKFGLSTNVRERKNFLRDKSIKYYWFNKMLTLKGFDKKIRTTILETFYIPDVCPVLGIPLNYEGTGRGGYTRREDSPSVDQIIPGKGYTVGNIVIISWRANRIKNDGTPKEHLQIYEYYKDLTNDKLQVY